MGILGILILPLIAWLISEQKKNVSWRVVVSCIGLQFTLGLIFRVFPLMQNLLKPLNDLVTIINQVTINSSRFMFGYLAGGETPFTMTNEDANFIVAFQVLPIVLVTCALTALLYHFRILQLVIKGFSWLLEKTIGGNSVTLFAVASSLFLGVIETPILVKEYLKKLDRPQVFIIFTASMSTVAGTVMALYASVLSQVIENPISEIIVASVMSAPAAILFAHLMIPAAEKSSTMNAIDLPRTTNSAFEAIVQGTSEGLQMVLQIVAFIIVIFALVGLVNIGLGLISVFEQPLSLQLIFGWIYQPFFFLIGIPWEETFIAGKLMATKTVLNEFVAYLEMSRLSSDMLSEHSRLILTYAMCGFANFGSVGILIAGIGTLFPERKKDISQLAVRALVSGNLATLYTGAVIGIISQWV